MIQPIYLDYNATTPLDPEVIEAMRPFFETHFGNPSSIHWYGIEPRQAIHNARKQTAALINCESEQIIFTSGGTEANNHAIQASILAGRKKGRHIITSRIEHPAVLEVCRFLEKAGCHTTYLPVDADGIIGEIAQIAKKHGIMMHTDAAQSVGKIPADVRQLGVDMLSLAGHKIYAPKGVGALYVDASLKIEKMIHGAGQEMNRRAGTENVMGIVGLGKACEIARRDLIKNMMHMARMRDLLYTGLQRDLTEIRRNGHETYGLPNTLNLSFAGVAADRVLEAIGLEVAASAGAACHSDRVEISHVLQAMAVPGAWAKGTLRFSTGRGTKQADIHRAVEVITAAVDNLRNS
jgi:cysteine desulfurase